MKSWVSAFVGKRAVIAFYQQEHGRTPKTSREMSDEQFADDAGRQFASRLMSRGSTDRAAVACGELLQDGPAHRPLSVLMVVGRRPGLKT